MQCGCRLHQRKCHFNALLRALGGLSSREPTIFRLQELKSKALLTRSPTMTPTPHSCSWCKSPPRSILWQLQLSPPLFSNIQSLQVLIVPRLSQKLALMKGRDLVCTRWCLASWRERATTHSHPFSVRFAIAEGCDSRKKETAIMRKSDFSESYTQVRGEMGGSGLQRQFLTHSAPKPHRKVLGKHCQHSL